MPLQMIHVYQRNAQTPGKSLGETHTHQQRPHQSGTSRKGHSRQLFLRDAGPLDGLMHHRHHILLMRPRCQFRHHAAVSLMHSLRRRRNSTLYLIYIYSYQPFTLLYYIISANSSKSAAKVVQIERNAK